MSNATIEVSVDGGDNGTASTASVPPLPLASEPDGMRAWAEVTVPKHVRRLEGLGARTWSVSTRRD
jgi:hypothetical protein